MSQIFDSIKKCLVIVPDNEIDINICNKAKRLEQSLYNAYWGGTIDADYEIIPPLGLPFPETKALNRPL